jgi:hypothetical protein
MIQEQLFQMMEAETPQTRVVHCRREPYDVYIGRKTRELQGSIWGNPFQIGRDGTREEVIAKYREYILSKPALLKQLESLRGKTLGCWCSPQACHGDVLIELLSREQLPPEPPIPVIQHETLGPCVSCGKPATRRSPSGKYVYCEDCGRCGAKTVKETALGISVEICGRSVEQFVKHPRMGVYVCPCVLAFEREIQDIKRSAS